MSTALTIQEQDGTAMTMAQGGGTVTTAIQAMAAMADKRISTARLYPRSIARFKQEASDLLKEDVETARSAEYAKPVGVGTVKGPSVRLAELAAMCWGNLEIEVSEPVVNDNSVFVKATAWDLQRNYRQDGTATTSILDKNGKRYKASMIETACAATAAKAKRNAIMAVIPRAYITDLLQVAKQVASGHEKPLEQRRIDLLDFFARTYKVQPEQIFTLIGVDGMDSITGEHLDELRAVATALKDGDAKVEELFGKAESKVEAVLDRLKERASGKPETTVEVDLEAAIAAFTEAGGILEEFAEKNNLSPKAIKASRGEARKVWAESLNAETAILKGAK